MLLALSTSSVPTSAFRTFMCEPPGMKIGIETGVEPVGYTVQNGPTGRAEGSQRRGAPPGERDLVLQASRTLSDRGLQSADAVAPGTMAPPARAHDHPFRNALRDEAHRPR